MSREFYLEIANGYDGECIAYSEKVDGLDENAIHVIEYSAYQDLQRKLEIAKHSLSLLKINLNETHVAIQGLELLKHFVNTALAEIKDE